MDSTATARILIVDDEPHVRKVISRSLTKLGYECAMADSGEEALDVLSEREFDLLISDIMMPGMSGLDLLQVVRQQFPDMAVIMVTAVDERATAIRSLELGAYGYMIKPFDNNELVISVVNALERRRLTLVSQAYGRRLEEEVRARTEDIRRREEEIALRLVSASEYRDEETGAHIRRIGLYVAVLAEAMGWPQEEVESIRVAGPMHDIGKIGVPDHILLKPGKLTREEFETMKTHTDIGAGILTGSDVPLLHMAMDIAQSHHEKWDGSGYPGRLVGQQIPKAARLVAAADVYDALVHDRVYRPAMPEDQALGIMQENCGTQFDPDVFECFLRMLPKFRRIRGSVIDDTGSALAEGHAAN